MFFFFFSSRRRHTRCGRDWSSDVCSSDLEPEVEGTIAVVGKRGAHGCTLPVRSRRRARAEQRADENDTRHDQRTAASIRPRSEEHTSELHSRPHLVCRLLLEKKKNSISSLQTHNKNRYGRRRHM